MRQWRWPSVEPLARGAMRRRGCCRCCAKTQEQLGFLPAIALQRISDELGVSIATARGVAAFYSFLYTEPQGAYRLLFSDNVTDRMHGSAVRMREMGERLWVEPGKISEDGS